MSGGFTPAPEVELVSQEPIVQVGDGHDGPRDGLGSGQAYEHRVWFTLDEPLPVDARVRPYAIEQQTYGNDDGPDTVVLDGGYPTLPGDSVLVKAGETRGYFVINYWGDEWRRFEWSRTVYGLTSSTAGWTHDDRRIGALDVDQVRAEHLMYEDDPHRWPLVSSGSISVEAGRTARVPVRLRTPAARRTTVSYRTTAGSAEPSRDYTARRGTVTIARGARVAWVRVPTRARRADVGRTRDFRVRVIAVRDDAARVLRQSGTTVRLR